MPLLTTTKPLNLIRRWVRLQDAKKIECRRIAFLGSKLKEKICLTKTQWAVSSMKVSMPNNKSITQEEMEYFNITLGRN